MVTNQDIARQFDRIANLLELDQANPYRVQTYRRIAGIIRRSRQNLATLVRLGRDPTEIPGIGRDSAAKIREIVLTGSSHYLDRITRRVPAGLRRLQAVPGLGPQRIRQLYEKLHIQTLTELRRAARAQRIRQLSGFGPVLERKILQASQPRARSSR